MSILHNDFKLDNCQFDPADPDRVKSVFDWDQATLGDPLVDVGITLNYWPDPADVPGLEPILNPGTESLGLPGRAEVIDQYAARTGYEVDDVRWYEAFAAWKTAVVLQQLYARWVRGESTDPRMAERGPKVEGQLRRAIDPRWGGAVTSIGGSLAGQWALVTGASKGIGYGIAERLVDEGANVVLVARDRDDLEEAQHTLEKVAGDGQRVVVRSTDTADRAAIANLFAWVRDELPGLNVLVAMPAVGRSSRSSTCRSTRGTPPSPST